jgi:hypothetical protein
VTPATSRNGSRRVDTLSVTTTHAPRYPNLTPAVARRLRAALVAEGVDLDDPWPVRRPVPDRGAVDDPIRAARTAQLVASSDRIQVLLATERESLATV